MPAPVRFGSISPFFEMSGDEAKGLLYGLLESNKIQLRKNPDMPSVRELIQQGKIRYDRADPNEHWQTYRELIQQVEKTGSATGDCEDLATAIAAEDQIKYGVSSLPFAYSPREGLFHVVTAIPADRYGGIPSGQWPGARGATAPPGYVLQDPSAAAGMGSGFGYIPEREVPMSYGANDGRGLGSIVRSLRDGALGGANFRQAARDVGEGARAGSGIGDGFFRSLGEKIPGALGIGGAIRPREDSAVRALQKGMNEKESPSQPPEEEDDDDLEDEDEEFGLSMAPDPSAMVGSGAWWLDQTSDRAVDAMFGSDGDAEDSEGKKFHAPGWLFPAIAGAVGGAALAGAGSALFRKKKSSRDEDFGGIDDLVADEMFEDDDDDEEFGTLSSSLLRQASSGIHEETMRGTGPLASLNSLRRPDAFGASSSEGFRFVRDDEDDE